MRPLLKHHFVHQIRMLRLHAVRAKRRRPPRQLHPTALALDYFKAIRGYLDRARSMLEHRIFPKLPALLEQARNARGDSVRLDTINDDVDKVSKDFFDGLNIPQMERLSSEMASSVSEFQKRQLQTQITALAGVDVFITEPNLIPLAHAFTLENVALIKSVPTQYFSDIEKTITAAVRSGDRWETLSEELQRRYGVSEAKAALIARDQTGKFYGELNEARQTALGVEKFIWRTAHDDRVRDEHADLDGEEFPWDEPPDEGIPGEPINCRCFAEPVLGELLGEAGVETVAPEAAVEPEPEPAPEQSTEASIAKIEADIVDNRIEHGHVVDETGATVFSKTGNHNSIEFSGEELRNFKDNVFTHNHPSGTSLSPQDLHLAIASDLKEVRAIGRGADGTVRAYSLERPSAGWVSKQDAQDAVNKWNKLIFKKVNADVIAGRMDAKQAAFEHWHNVWMGAAKELGIDYQVRVIKKA